MRSKWKGMFVQKELFKKIKLKKRNSRITKEIVGKKIYVYNGAKWVILKVKPSYLGFPLSDFVWTKFKCPSPK